MADEGKINSIFLSNVCVQIGQQIKLILYSLNGILIIERNLWLMTFIFHIIFLAYLYLNKISLGLEKEMFYFYFGVYANLETWSFYFSEKKMFILRFWVKIYEKYTTTKQLVFTGDWFFIFLKFSQSYVYWFL